MENDQLVIDGIRYSIDDIGRHPEELAVYKSAEKSNQDVLAFHGEFSPYSNFHCNEFTINSQLFHSSEQFIQYQKVLMSGDSYTANKILLRDSPLEAKKLGYKINGFDINRWKNDGYSICLERIRTKFVKSHNLLQMLRSTSPKLLVEASSDRTWERVYLLETMR